MHGDGVWWSFVFSVLHCVSGFVFIRLWIYESRIPFLLQYLYDVLCLTRVPLVCPNADGYRHIYICTPLRFLPHWERGRLTFIFCAYVHIHRMSRTDSAALVPSLLHSRPLRVTRDRFVISATTDIPIRAYVPRLPLRVRRGRPGAHGVGVTGQKLRR